MEKNILSDLVYDPKWETASLHDEQKENIRQILNQKFTYLGKGCQSYVFESEDGQYVLKFLKYQRFKLQPWLPYLTSIPGMDGYVENKTNTKKQKLHRLYASWKLAYDYLQNETGTIYVHLNHTNFLNQTLQVTDKIGLSHEFDMDKMQFMLQKKVHMICPAIDAWMAKNEEETVKKHLVALVEMILSEYDRGLADKDHALMQNTGFDHAGNPIHLDVGLFVKDEQVKNPAIYKHELFSKTYKFRIWLKKQYPSIEKFFTAYLLDIIGPEMRTMIPKLVTLDEGKDGPLIFVENSDE